VDDIATTDLPEVLPTAGNVEEAAARLGEWLISTPVLEPSGAAALAAVLGGAAKNRTCAGVVLSGANVDLDRHTSALEAYPDP
jgi:threonine dehydratase